MLIFLYLVAALVAVLVSYVTVDNHVKGIAATRKENKALKATLRDVELVASGHRDLHPLFAQVVLDEIDRQRAKAIEQ